MAANHCKSDHLCPGVSAEQDLSQLGVQVAPQRGVWHAYICLFAHLKGTKGPDGKLSLFFIQTPMCPNYCV